MATNSQDDDDDDDDDDSGQICAMLLSAKSGSWDVVFDILEDKPYLVNCISSERAWGVLHQAAWMNDFSVVQRLIQIPGCDPAIKTRRDSARKHGPGKTPRDLSTDHGIQSYLLQAEKKSMVRTQIILAPTCVFIQNESELTGSSIGLALLCFKEVLCTKLDFDGSYSFSFIMKTIFQECLTNWVIIKNKISLALEMDNFQMSEFLKNGFYLIDTMEEFFSRVIKVYTDGRDNIYQSLNKTLALQGNPSHIPKGCDIALSSYAILLNAILMNWETLDKCNRRTYRCMSLSPNDLSLYQAGESFTWLNFSSSSVQRDVAESFAIPGLIPVTFIIENKSTNRWSPRYISAHSSFPGEDECLYPCGTRFLVTKVNGTDVSLKLLKY